MNKIISRGLWGVLCVGGLSVLGATAAHAAETTGDDGTAAGTQALVSVDLPVTIGGNAIGILGDSEQSGGSAAQPAAQPSVDVAPPSTSGIDSLLGGTQAVLDIAVPITVSGNSIGVAGDTSAEYTDAAPAAPTEVPPAEAPAAGTTTDGSDGILGGTQVLPQVTAPITVGGNAIGVLGDSAVDSGTAGGAANTNDGAANATTDGSDGILGGTQIVPVVTLPIDVGGNAIGIIGDSTVVEGAGDDPVTNPGTEPGSEEPGSEEPGSEEPGTGAVITLPIDLGGNAIGVVGDSTVVEGAGDDPVSSPGTEPGSEEPGSEEPGTGAGGAIISGVTSPGAGAAGAGVVGDDGVVMTAAAAPADLAATGAASAPASMLGLLLVVAGLALAALTRMRARAA